MTWMFSGMLTWMVFCGRFGKRTALSFLRRHCSTAGTGTAGVTFTWVILPDELLIVTAACITVALVASLIPAFQATRVDPVKSLRQD